MRTNSLTEPNPQHSLLNMERTIQKRRILITCGTGGVGKTTVSAALAMFAALQGKKTLVITMDPAKRLAHALGMETLSDQPTHLTPLLKELHQKFLSKEKSLPQSFPIEFSGSLDAIIPDTRNTFERMLKELAPNPWLVEQVKKNPIFQVFSQEYSGTHEYMALERLYKLNKSGNYDCIILDTPPSRNTLNFLNAPKRLSQFFDEKIIKWLVLPANKLLSTGIRKALSILEKLTGAGFMTHFFDFAEALLEVRTNFSGKLQEIGTLLESPQVAFFMVTTPTPDTLPEAQHFIEKLKEQRFHLEGLILNRTFEHLDPQSDTNMESGFTSGLEDAFKLLHALQEREHRVIQELMRYPSPICAKIPELARDIHSAEDLLHVAMAFFHDPDLSVHTGGNRNSPSMGITQ